MKVQPEYGHRTTACVVGGLSTSDMAIPPDNRSVEGLDNLFGADVAQLAVADQEPEAACSEASDCGV